MKKILLIILTYNAERHIEKLLGRVSQMLANHQTGAHYDVLLLDDASQDKTVEKARSYVAARPLSVHILSNPINHGYGGNQKIGYAYAIAQGYDIAVMLHGDGQYPPEMIRALIEPLLNGTQDAMLGSRMINKRGAIKGGMPLYKFLGNIVVTTIQNRLLGTSLSEFHTGFRAYLVAALKELPFQTNSNDFDFDTDILIQFLIAKKRIGEIAIPTHYGDEICHVNGLRYVTQVLWTTCLARLQHLHCFYRPKFDLGPKAVKH